MESLAKVRICIALQSIPTPRRAASAPDMVALGFRPEKLSYGTLSLGNRQAERRMKMMKTTSGGRICGVAWKMRLQNQAEQGIKPFG
jgi:hypothetical protein